MLSNVNSVIADSNKDDLIKLAENGDKVAQYSLANLLLAQHIDKNNKIKKYDNEVVYWYQQSAEQGYPEAQFALAMIYIQQKINAVYISKVRLPDKVYPDTLTFFKGKDSQLYQNVLSYKLLRVQL